MSNRSFFVFFIDLQSLQNSFIQHGNILDNCLVEYLVIRIAQKINKKTDEVFVEQIYRPRKGVSKIQIRARLLKKTELNNPKSFVSYFQYASFVSVRAAVVGSAKYG